MKYIRMLFWVIFLMPTLVFSQDKAQDLDTGWIRFIEVLDAFATETRQSIQEAQNKPRADLSRFEWTNLLFWDEQNVSPLTGTRGSSPMISTPFGSVQLLTDVVGTQNRNTVHGVVDVIIQKGWTVDPPVFQIQETKNIQSARFFTPTVPPLKENINKPYVINAVFPFLLELNQPGLPVSLSVTVDLKACSDETCLTQSYPLSLELDGLRGETSPFKPFIASAWSYLPRPVSLDPAPIYRTPDDMIWIDIPNKYAIADTDYILSSDMPLALTQERIIQTDRGIRLILKTEPSLKGKPVQLTYAGVNGIWTMTTQAPIEKEIPKAAVDNSWFQTGWLFLIASPLLCWLFLWRPNNEYEVRQKARQTLFVFIPIGLTAALYFSLFPVSYGGLFSSFFWISACILIFIIMYVLPQKPTPLTYAVLTLIAPLTYIAPVWNNADSGIEKTLLCLYLTGMACLPYLLFYLFPYGTVRLFKQTKTWSTWLIKLPLLGCALWYALMGSALLIHQRINWPVYSPEAAQQLLEQNEIILVSVGPNWCVTCTLNRLNLTYVGVAKTLRQQNKMTLMTAINSPLPQERAYPQNVIMTRDFPHGEKAPAFIPDYSMQKFFKIYSTAR